MATITVKSIPTELYTRLKQAAEANRRSINSQVIVCLEQALQSRRNDPEAVLARARQLRAITSPHPLSEAEIRAARDAGRP